MADCGYALHINGIMASASMNQDIVDYIKKARKDGASDDDIRKQLTLFKWPTDTVDAALKANLDLPVPPPPPSLATGPVAPVAVVKNMTTRGLEYFIMFIALWITATSFAWLLHNAVNLAFAAGSQSDPDTLTSLATPALLVAVPIFSVLFLRLKKAELTNPQLHLDPSRRHAIQLTLVITFIIAIADVIAYLYSLMSGSTADSLVGSSSSNGWADAVHMLVTLVVAGGIFVYYWRDIHQKD
jgi:hypothetical protein